MSVEEIQQLIDLLAQTPDVTELSVQGEAGNRVTIKRALQLPDVSYALVHSPSSNADPTESEEAESLKPTPAVTINATLVGLFHATNPPITSGASIVPGQIVGYIESMRLMNEIVSTVEGTVEAAIASEGQPVDYGQPLFAVASR